MKSVSLMGLRTIVCGMQPTVAQAMVGLGISGDGITFARTLREAIQMSRDDG